MGATGLMQLMPDTAKWIAGKLGEEYSEDSLTNPETNIKYGTWYLRYLLDKYNGDETSAIAAYNAGHSNVCLLYTSSLFFYYSFFYKNGDIENNDGNNSD